MAAQFGRFVARTARGDAAGRDAVLSAERAAVEDSKCEGLTRKLLQNPD
jgi:hypothetical protein